MPRLPLCEYLGFLSKALGAACVRAEALGEQQRRQHQAIRINQLGAQAHSEATLLVLRKKLEALRGGEEETPRANQLVTWIDEAASAGARRKACKAAGPISALDVRAWCQPKGSGQFGLLSEED